MNTNLPTPAIDDLETDVASLTVQLLTWNAGVFDPEQRHQRLAANDALDTIDDALRVLYQMRSELISQKRRYDDESARRTDELVRKMRAEWRPSHDRPRVQAPVV